jgi:DivIVA domain-containing protein
MTTDQNEAEQSDMQPDMHSDMQAVQPAQTERRLSPADLHHVQFTRAPMLRPGYVDAEVDRVLSRVAEEMSRLIEEKAALRDQVMALQMQVEGHQAQVPPSDQAVRILASAQLTADNYVAEAEEFSRQVTAEARSQYEEVTREARETAGAIIQAAQQAAATMTPDPVERDVAQLEEQVAYLKAFGQACRVQLRSYLEALLSDIETEWGRADPAGLPEGVAGPPAQRAGEDDEGAAPVATFEANTAEEHPPDDTADTPDPVGSGRGGRRSR